MKVLQLIPSLQGGGARRLMVDLANELLPKHNVYVVSLYNLGDKKSYHHFLEEDIETYSLGKKQGFDFRMIPALYRVVKEIEPDIIHSHLASFNYLMPLIPLFTKNHIVHTIHSDSFRECPNTVIRNFRKFFLKRKNVTPVTISESSEDSFLDAYGQINHKLIYNGRIHPTKSDNYSSVAKQIGKLRRDSFTETFLNIGRVSQAKNQLMLIRAFDQLLKKEKANANLVIIGGANDKRENQAIKESLKNKCELNDHIHYLGYKENATDYLYASDFFCLSSIYEGMPITLIESFATGCIPACTPVGGIPEMIKDLDESLLSVSTTEKDYYNLLKKLINMSEEKRDKMRKTSQQLFEEKYSIQYCSRQYVKLYNSVL